jgi:hypothetical protein
MDKPTLKANALAAMRAAVASDWAKVHMNVQQQRQLYDSIPYKMYRDSQDLLSIEIDAQLKKCYESLKEYYNG